MMPKLLKYNHSVPFLSKQLFHYSLSAGLVSTLLLTSGCSGIHMPPLPTQPGTTTGNTQQSSETGEIKTWMAAGNKAAQAKQWANATKEFNQVIAKDANYAKAACSARLGLRRTKIMG
jgi:hypothetical protein